MATPRKDQKDYLKRGRPTIYDEDLVIRICFLVATHTVGLKRLSAMYEDMPDEHTIRAWRARYPDFSRRYAEAKLYQAELLADECLDIADDSRNDWIESLSDEEKSNPRLHAEAINRSRLRIDTRKFLVSKLLPKKYGDFREEFQDNSKELHEEAMKRKAALYDENKKEY